MNANELADELEEFSGDGAFKYYLEIATMLRQLQAENEALKAHPADEKQSKFKPNNQVNFELTDEEINWLAKEYSTIEGELNAPAFARAILRKAQDKC